MRKFILFFAALMLAGCVTSTNELQLRQDVFLIQGEGRGLIGKASLNEALMKKAAEITIRQGYTHFTLAQPRTNSSSQMVGYTPVMANTQFIGSTAYTSFSGGQPIIARTTNTDVLVILSNGGAGSIDAAATLKRIGQ